MAPRHVGSTVLDPATGPELASTSQDSLRRLLAAATLAGLGATAIIVVVVASGLPQGRVAAGVSTATPLPTETPTPSATPSATPVPTETPTPTPQPEAAVEQPRAGATLCSRFDARGIVKNMPRDAVAAFLIRRPGANLLVPYGRVVPNEQGQVSWGISVFRGEYELSLIVAVGSAAERLRRYFDTGESGGINRSELQDRLFESKGVSINTETCPSGPSDDDPFIPTPAPYQPK